MPPPDLSQRHVRITRAAPNGFIEFEFTIADRDLSVDLILPQAAFEEFCATNGARVERPNDDGRADGDGLLKKIT
ncbi:MAG TPA: phenol hydroxylase subunit [Kofleriaceae bacterium]